jgi:pimeloyl-ACP methyl ester carboxylesterase
MSKPSILIVPGSFARPEFYDPIVSAVHSYGYPIHALHLPSVAPETGPTGPPPSLYDDAAFIAGEIEKLADEGKDVVLVAHSYGGVPATESLKGLSKEERAKDGKKGGVVRLAYLTCLVPAVGVNSASVLADVPAEARLELKIDVRACFCHCSICAAQLTISQENGWMYHDPIERSAEICFSDISKERGEAWMRKFSRHSSVSFMGELTYAGYKDVPVSYMLCEEDLCIPPKNQREGIDIIEKVSGRKVDVTSIHAGHIPNESQPQAVIDWIVGAAKKAEESQAA